MATTSITTTQQTAAFNSKPLLLSAGNVLVSISGTATSITAQVQRCDNDPNGPLGANWVPVDSGTTGNPSTGMQPTLYIEPGLGQWRIAASAVSGGYVNCTISGQIQPNG